jgi:trimeric autotransporter adhesin
MKKSLFALIALFVFGQTHAQSNTCGSATTLNSNASCMTTSGTLAGSGYTAIPAPCGNSSGNRNDVWYSFTANATQATITVSGALTAPRFQVYTNNCASLTSIFCSTGGSAAFSGLTPGTTYLLRVYCNNNSNTTFNVCIQHPAPTRMREVFADTVIASNGAGLNSPWEITYGSDGYLWVTESKTFLVRRINPADRYTSTPPASTIALDLNSASLPVGIRRNYTVGATVNGTATPDPQGGLMGLALHPEFNTNPAKRFVYVAYVRQYLGLNQVYAGETVNGHLFMNNLVRFTFNTGTGQLENPVVLCDTIRGSNDHNSGRIIIAPVGSEQFLFYAEGDMGAGQFANINRTIKAQNTQSYEGKILRFNLEPDADADQGAVDYNQWIPDDNPYNNIAPVTGQSAVYSIGHRNVQGFALIGTTLYGASHGPFSDDELNVLERGKNYGHPLVIGYSADENYNNAKGGPITSSLPLITSEVTNASTLADYKDPMYSFFNAPAGNTSTPWTIQHIYNNMFFTGPPSGNAQNLNQFWASIAPSGMDAYNDTKIPGWRNTLLMASLKKGYMMRVKPNAAQTGLDPIGGADTAAVFNTQNRFRDLAFDADGVSVYTVVDRSGSTSGPTSDNPVSSACAGCIVKYTFKGYHNSGGTSTIPSSIAVDSATTNSCVPGSTVVINAGNNNLWVPITGPNGDVVAEINANGNNLGTVTTSFFVKTGATRAFGSMPYMNRNITITPQNQPSTNVSIRLYFTAGEFNNLRTADAAVTTTNDLAILKNDDNCGSGYGGGTITQPVITGRYTQGSFGYALQASIPSFSTFYFANAASTLPFQLIRFSGVPHGEASHINWVVSDEDAIYGYELERSTDNLQFETITHVSAKRTGNGRINYQYADLAAARLGNAVYYRLKVKNADGNYRYSQVIRINFTNSDLLVRIAPNPAVDVANIQIKTSKEETASIRIVDQTGRVVLQQKLHLVKGWNVQQLNISKLPSGMYFVEVHAPSFNQKQKLIKQ